MHRLVGMGAASKVLCGFLRRMGIQNLMKKLINDRTTWHRWFAWYPVIAYDSRNEKIYYRVWWEYVERRLHSYAEWWESRI